MFVDDIKINIIGGYKLEGLFVDGDDDKFLLDVENLFDDNNGGFVKIKVAVLFSG